MNTPIHHDPVSAPSSQVVAACLAKAAVGHPRLFGDAAHLARISTLATSDHRITSLLSTIMDFAELALRQPPVERVLVGRRLLDKSRTALARISFLGIAWHVTGDERFAARGIRELEAVIAFSDWNPSHFLDTAEMTTAAAIGYDWFHAALSEELRARIRTAIVTLGIQPSFAPDQWWVAGTNNWTQVGHAGMLAGALVIHEYFPELATEVIRRAVENFPLIMAESYAPDGTYPEGPMYWAYGTTYNVIAIDLLETVLGDDFGLRRQPGFLASGDYVAHAHGPTLSAFNYADGVSAPRFCSAARIWFAQAGAADWSVNCEALIADGGTEENRFLALGLLWACAATITPARELPLDYHGTGHKPVAMFRSAWNDRHALYLGVCAGKAAISHGHMDAGSFVFEAQGVRWAIDLGMQDYFSLESKGVDLWNSDQTGQRWQIFRLNNHGHNVLTIDDLLHHATGDAVFTTFNDHAQSPGCSLDLTPVYAGQAQHVTRRFSLPGRSSLMIEDRLVGLTAAGTVRWQMLTKAHISVVTDGRQARLTQDGKVLIVTLQAPLSARLIASASQPPQAYDADNPGVSILAVDICTTAGETVEITVTLTPTTAA